MRLKPIAIGCWQLPTTWMAIANNLNGNCQQPEWQLPTVSTAKFRGAEGQGVRGTGTCPHIVDCYCPCATACIWPPMLPRKISVEPWDWNVLIWTQKYKIETTKTKVGYVSMLFLFLFSSQTAYSPVFTLISCIFFLCNIRVFCHNLGTFPEPTFKCLL